MTGARESPKLPWWVTWFTTYDTTRKSMRQDAWIAFSAGAAVLVGCGGAAAHGQWLPVAWAGFFPAAVLLDVCLWTLAAVSWLDRNRAWDRVAAQPRPQRSPRVAGGVAFLIGLLLLALSGWRFWVSFLGPDDSLLWSSRPLQHESLQLVQEHNARVQEIKARVAMKEEYEQERQRYEAADEELRLRQEAERRAAAAQWRWLEVGTASLVLFFGLVVCVGGYLQFRGVRSDRAVVPEAESGVAPDRRPSR